MKNIQQILTLVFASFILLSSCCLDGDCDPGPTVDPPPPPPPPVPEDVRSYNFTIKRNDLTISNASVLIETFDQLFSATTDNQGRCQIKIPNDVSLPTYVIVTVDHSSIRPRAFSVPGATYNISNLSVPCKETPSTVLVKETSLHHLGNDQYGGSANSQHQLPTEGIERSFSFYLSGIPGTMPYLQLYARGIEHPTEIKINGITTNKLGNSSSDGDLSKWDIQLNPDVIPSNVFQAGYNTLTIKTGANDASDPWDDIEFCALLLYYP